MPKYSPTAIITEYAGAINGSSPIIKNRTPNISRISRFSNPKGTMNEKIQ